MSIKKLNKSHNHNHFWIEDSTVYESYNTIRGLRFRPVAEVIMNDTNKMSDEDVKLANEILEANVC